METVFFDGRTAVDLVGPTGLGHYSNRSKASLEEQYGKLELISLDEAVNRVETRACTDPVEVEREEWDEALNVLPPLLWRNDGHTESFRCVEATVGTVHSTYVRVGNRYFAMQRPIREDHVDLVARVSRYLLRFPKRSS